MTLVKRNFAVSIIDNIGLKIDGLLETKLIKISRDKIRELLTDIKFLDRAPFTWIGLMYRYGEKNTFEPEYKRIDKKDGELPIAIEIASDWIEYASFNNEAMLEQIFESTALIALIYVGKKYNLPIDGLDVRLKEIGGFPELPEDYYEKLPPNPHRVPKDQLPQLKM